MKHIELQGISKDEARARFEAEEQARQRDFCDSEIEKAMPPLRKALKEISKINKRDIAELKSLKKPPAGLFKMNLNQTKYFQCNLFYLKAFLHFDGFQMTPEGVSSHW